MAFAEVRQDIKLHVIHIYAMSGEELFLFHAVTYPTTAAIRVIRDRGPSVLNFRLACKDGTRKIGEELSCNESPYTFIQHKNTVLTASDDDTAKLWDAESGTCVHTFQGHGYSVCSAIFSPDASEVLTASDDDTAKLWDAETGECVQTFQGHGGSVYSAVFSPDASKVLTASGDDTAKLWDAESGECVQTFQGHGDPVCSAIFM